MSAPPPFPLSAIVGQEQLIEALLINTVSPEAGGVLVRGDRGTAKTTAVRGLASLLAPAPLVELPLGATLDRLVGSLDLSRALAGEHAVETGLLAKADGGILYVDEVNLLADHLVDALLDAAATGVVRVEREAISRVQPARFLLVGTMNPEEGELRPQLLDRFGLGVEVRTPEDPSVRAEIVRRRLAFERDPLAFVERFAAEEAALAARIAAARELVGQVLLPERQLMRITGACARLGVDGIRGDIVTASAARALAALDGSDEVGEEHVRRAAALALTHRRRRDPLEGHAPDPGELGRALGEEGERRGEDGPSGDDEPPGAGGPPPPSPDGGATDSGRSPGEPAREPRGSGVAAQRVSSPLPARLPPQALTLGTRGRGPLGRTALSAGPHSGAIDSREAAPGCGDLALVATLRARLLGAPDDELRQHVRAGRESTTICLIVDVSGSMGARRRLARVKGALLELLRDAYARRDRVAIVAFRDRTAEVVLAPGAPLERAASAIRAMPTGGRTPLAEGLAAAGALIRRERMREPDRRVVAVLLSDGRAADPDGAITRAAAALGKVADRVSVIDTEEGAVRLGLAARIAAAAGGSVHPLLAPAARGWSAA
ncbi:MAG: VWA domain-containing protein [Actinomycetota bacterium]|nr:VWA domain-containing protein [Actinomycetota bacterium]